MDSLFDSENARIAEALRFAGIHINGIDELVNTSQSYPKAIPLLVKLLTEVRHPRMKEAIARALTVRESRPFVAELIAEFRRLKGGTSDEEHAKWAIGNAIGTAAGDDSMPEVIALMMERSHGWTRFMLPRALLHAKNRDVAVTALLHALDDDDLLPEAVKALAKLRSKQAVEPLRRLAKHRDADVRKLVAKALERLQRDTTSRRD